MAATTFDCIVLGLGGMGSQAALHLARRGHRVLGVEQHAFAQPWGSSHGESRIYRLAYHEHPTYVPLLVRAHELWLELEARAALPLHQETGYATAWPADSPELARITLGLDAVGSAYQVLDAAACRQRFPGLCLPDGFRTVVQAQGGMLFPELCVAAALAEARHHGAQLHEGERVLSWEETADGVVVRSERAEYRAAQLVVCAGPWAARMATQLGAVCVPERQVLAWFAPRDRALFAPERFPVFGVACDLGRFYGFPFHADLGIKLGLYHHLGEVVDPDTMTREAGARDEAPLRAFVQRFLPAADGPAVALSTCMFTNSPDEHPLIGRLPGHQRVFIAAGFSGHGFKLCSVVGELLADLVLHGSSPWNLPIFAPGRFAAPPGQGAAALAPRHPGCG